MIHDNGVCAIPVLETGCRTELAVYDIGIKECNSIVDSDSTLCCGAGQTGVLTGDVSYSIINCMSFMQTEAAKLSLLSKVNAKGEVVQDAGIGGSWPCYTDREVWVCAAWEIFKVTGDMDWLKTVWPIVRKSLEVDIRTVFDEETNLFKGGFSCCDWDDMYYPEWMQPSDVYDTKSLSTNVVFYNALNSASEMGFVLGEDQTAIVFKENADLVKKGVNENLWQKERGHYGQYLGGYVHESLYAGYDVFGHSLVALSGIAADEYATRLYSTFPVLNDCVYSPFVLMSLIRANAQAGNESGVFQGLSSLWDALMNTSDDSSINVLNVSANLGATFKVLFGIDYGVDSLCFNPFVPQRLKGKRTLKSFHYRNSTLDISVSGYGDSIKTLKLDGKVVDGSAISGNLVGHHKVEISMSNSFRNKYEHLPKKLRNPLATPEVIMDSDRIFWDYIDNAAYYDVFAGGKHVARIDEPEVQFEDWYGDLQVIAVAADGTVSHPSNPFNIGESIYESFPERYLTRKEGNECILTVSVPYSGEWALSWHYANGTGPVNRDNNCGVRMLYVDGNKVGINVFPQRGRNQWDDWGWTSPQKIKLSKGEHTFALIYESDVDNMDLYVNDFKVNKFRLTRLKN